MAGWEEVIAFILCTIVGLLVKLYYKLGKVERDVAWLKRMFIKHFLSSEKRGEKECSR